MLFLDAACVVYLVEHTPLWFDRIEPIVRLSVTNGELLCVSDLIRMECLVHPLRLGDMALKKKFDDFFHSADVVVGSIDALICEQAASIRAIHAFKPLDALHLAAAMQYRCSKFVTNDKQLRQFTSLPVQML